MEDKNRGPRRAGQRDEGRKKTSAGQHSRVESSVADADTQTGVDEALEFLEWLRQDGPWLLIAIQPDRRDPKACWCATLEDAAEFIETWDGERNLYYNLNPTMQALNKKPSKPDIACAEFLHADCDPEDDETPEEAKARYLKIAESFEPRPSAALDSGNGIQFLWALDEPLEDPLDAEPYNLGLLHAFGAHAGTQNVDRILRVPGTTNLPNAKKRKAGRTKCEAHTLWLEDSAYSISVFEKAEPASKSKSKPKSKKTAKKANGSWPKVDIETLPCTDEWKALIVEGVGMNRFDTRSEAVWHVARELLKQGVEDEAIMSVLLAADNAISEHVLEQSSPVRAAQRAIDHAQKHLGQFVTDKNGLIIPSVIHNVRLAIERLGVTLSYDDFAARVLVTGLEGFGPTLDDHVLDRLWIMIDEQFHFRPSKELLITVIKDDAITKGRFHPVLDMLDSFEWDGKPRIDRWLIEYAGAKDTKYVRAVSAITLIAAVRRVRQPGCKFDELLVLESPQGTDKSTAIAILALQDDWFTDNLPLNATSKVVIEQMSGKWIAEAGELSGMRRGDVEKLKNLLSTRKDRARLSYDRLATEPHRQWIAIGTTNNRNYLKDQTGNRRFWPVEVKQFNTNALRRDLFQLWAEACVREAKGESIRLAPALWEAAGIEQTKRTAHDPWAELLGHYLGEYKDARISAEDIWVLLGVKPDRRTQEQNARMGEAIRQVGFRRPKSGAKLRIDGKLVSGYVRGKGRQHLHVSPPMTSYEEPFVEVVKNKAGSLI